MLALINDTGMIVLVVAIVLLFGASQIPKVARNIAQAGKEFRQAQAEIESGHADHSDHQASSDHQATADKS